MSAYEAMQWAAIAGGAVVFVLVAWAIARVVQKANAIWPDTAKKLGLAFRENDAGNAFTSGQAREKILEGTLGGIPVRLSATRTQNGRIIRRSTVLRAKSPSARTFTANVQRQGPGDNAFHAVKTGDARFDQVFLVSSESADAVRARLDEGVRAALIGLPLNELTLTATEAELVVAYPGLPDTAQQLEGLFGVLSALARTPAPATSTIPDPNPPPSPTRDRGAYVAQLAQTHGFTVEALDENRAGRVHPSQLRLANAGGGPIVTAVLALITFAGGVGGAFALYDDFRKPISRVDLNGIYALGAAGVVLSLIFAAITAAQWAGNRRTKRAFAGAPSVVEGPLQKIQIAGQGLRFQYQLDGRVFDVTKEGWMMTTQGARYRAWFIERQLLSLEPAQ